MEFSSVVEKLPVYVSSLVDNIYIVSEKNIKITLSNGYEFEKMKQFAYAGESPVSVTITNETQTTNRVVYAAGKVLNKE